ncbi:flagellar hook-length control protein FliK [Agarivorans sp. TSD2052]|uniref:flagellar hook-length control protein FliK n=1 Tax=Agarivorans sp. TSD2052 TaxID=2937286 RepID=UPI00200DDEF3|nr:flagellar hook-length control protein FliK [Agarivorans sp. TSD2052]UPW20013.1 flagellar hook-length control protein FliK [Agarivorans sp. TSD2052]
MELLLTDTANANQFGSLDSTSTASSAEGKDFANMVKELALLPKADSPLRAAIEKQYSAANASDSKASRVSPRAQSPSELLQQLAEATQMAKGLESAEQAANTTSGLDPLVDSIDIDADTGLEAQADSETKPEQALLASKAELKAGEASGRELPPVAADNKLAPHVPTQQAEIEAKASANNQVTVNAAEADNGQVLEGKALVKDGAMLEQASANTSGQVSRSSQEAQGNGAPSQSSEAKSVSATSALIPNHASVTKDSVETSGKAEPGPNSVQLVSNSVSAENKKGEGLAVAAELVTTKQHTDAVKREQAPSFTNAEQVAVKGEDTLETKTGLGQDSSKLAANKEALPVDGHQTGKSAANTLDADKTPKNVDGGEANKPKASALDAEKSPKTADNAKQLEANQKKDIDASLANKSHSEKAKHSAGDISGNSQTTENKPSVREGANENRSPAKVVINNPPSSVEHNAAQTDAKTAATSQTLESSSAVTKEQVVLSQEPKLTTQANHSSSHKASAAEANQFSEKLSNISSDGSSPEQHSNQQEGSHREPGQQTQAQPATLVNASEAPRPQDHHSIFRAVSGADIANRAELSNEVSLKQAQQANQVLDKDIQMNQRLNPAHYQAPAELNQRVQYMLSQGMQKAEIRLDPAELGSMHIRLQMNQDQQVSVQIQVQNPQAREALEQTMPRLREMLQQQGIELGQSHVNQQHQGGSSQHGQGQSASAGMGTNFDGVDESTEQDLSALLANQANSDGIDFYA